MMIRTYADIDEATLTTAEKIPLAKCRAGVETRLEDGALPEAPSDARTVPGSLLRYLICGGCEAWPFADKGHKVTVLAGDQIAEPMGSVGVRSRMSQHQAYADSRPTDL
jgi:hypothetical protein